MHVRFSAPDAFSSANRGRLIHDPGLVGTWVLTATAQQNTCGGLWAARHWILVPDEREVH